MGMSLCLVSDLIPPHPKCRLSAPRPRALRDAQLCHRLGFCERCQPVATGWGTRKSSSPPGPGGAAPRALRPRRGDSCHMLDHVSRRRAANNPKALPVRNEARWRAHSVSRQAASTPPLSLSARGLRVPTSGTSCGAEVPTFNL